jgi:hypothetical protein
MAVALVLPPSSVFQILMVLSSPPVASQLPSGEIATARTVLVWPVRVARGVPSAFQVRTVPSLLAVASQLPSGEIATAFTAPAPPAQGW